METGVVWSVEMLVQSAALSGEQRTPPIEIRMLGPLTIRRHEAALELPASRKVRGLLAFLTLAPHAVTRSQLCELLWEVPSDPRGELRWCLSKLRRLLDEPERRRVLTQTDTIRLDLADCFVDAVEVSDALGALENTGTERLAALAALFAGDFLEGLEIDDSPTFNSWLAAQRRRFKGYHTAVLERLVESCGNDEVLAYLEKWLELAPFDPRVHERLLRALVRRDRIREAEDHVATTIRLFEAEGLDSAELRDAWHASVRDTAALEPRRASVAVMPFVDASDIAGVRGGIADALAHDVITKLAKLRSLFVIAQGSVFALHERRIAADKAGQMLEVDFVASGSVRRQGDRLTVAVELAESRTARIIWSEVFNYKLEGAFQIMDEIADNIVASIAGEIESSERNRAILKPPNSLDAWEAHHRGLWHMYRFTKLDNEQAQHFFEMAVKLDPTFARAYAGLSFTHFQNVFQGWAQRSAEIERAYEAAGQSLMADDRDPAAHWAMGRALWLRQRHEQSIRELEQAIDLSPNFALGHYTLSFVHAQAGDPGAAISFSERSQQLSPFDPLLFGMLGSRAMAFVRMGRFEEAAQQGVMAAARPNAHAHILAIAAFSLALAGRLDEARAYLASIHKTLPHYSIDDFLAAMHFDPEGERLFRESAKRLGLAGR